MLQHRSDHAAAALARLAEQFRAKPKLERFLNTFTDGHQSVEEALWQLFTERYVDTAIGRNLDVIGRIVGEARGNSADDDEYRLRIKARIRCNLSNGTIDDIYDVFRILLPNAGLKNIPAYPAGFVFEISGAITASYAQLYARFLGQAKAAGVNADLLWYPTSDHGMFQFMDVCSFLPSNVTALSSPTQTIPLINASFFPSSGIITFEPGTDIEETTTFSGRDNSNLFNVEIGNDHKTGAAVCLIGVLGAPAQGWGTTSNPAIGGQLAGVINA